MTPDHTPVDLHPHTQFVDGRFSPGDGTERFPLIDPSTGEMFATVPDGTAIDVDRAVRAAKAASEEGPWPGLDRVERAAWLRALADALESRGREIAALVTREVGHPHDFSVEKNVIRPAQLLRYYAEVCEHTPPEETRPSVSWPGETDVRRRPFGVAGLIVPWNYPQSLTMAKLAPALAAGCTVVVKPAPQTSLDAHLLALATLDIGLPRGVVNVVTGGTATGAALVAHPDVGKISFTGSTAAGRIIAAECGRLLRPVTLELGGKSACVVLPDADLDELAAQLPRLAFANAGQTCHAHSRLIVPHSLVGQVEEIAESVAAELVVGHPEDPATTMGPLISARQRDQVDAHVAAARRSGSRVITGGRPAAGLPGFFYEPTVIGDVAADQPIAQEELFGPVLTITGYAHESDAVRIANATPYGLAGTVFSRDHAHAALIARRLRSGAVGVNGFRPDIGAPFGGIGISGLGREYGPESIEEYRYVQSVYRPD